MGTVINEGGINWNWFTKINIINGQVEILSHFRLHKGDYDNWPEECKDAKSHPNYYASEIWRETKDRMAKEYYVPEKGWYEIVNSKYIFDY